MTRRPEDRAPRLRRSLDELGIEDTSWLSLGQLRALVAKADELGWDDSSLISHGTGSDHPFRHDVRPARRLVIEGNDPTPEASS